MRAIWIDYVRALACIMVVLLHVAAYYIIHFSVDGNIWLWANLIDSFTRVCVPLFFMITGYLLFQERAPHIRHFVRLFAALAFYSVFAFIVSAFVGVNLIPKILTIFESPVYYHLWYFYALVPVYLVGMVVAVRDVSLGTLVCFVAVFFILLNPSLAEFTGIVFKSEGVSGSIAYIGYAFAGALLGKLSIKARGLGFLCLVVFVMTSFAIFLMTQIASLDAGYFVKRYYQYTHVLVVIGSLSLFYALKVLVREDGRPSRMMVLLSSNSLAIYGFHAPILTAVRYWCEGCWGNYVWVEITLLTLIIIGVCIVLGLLTKIFDKKGFVT